MQVWEYDILTLGGPTEHVVQALNVLGQEGWEVYQAVDGFVGTTFYMKHPISIAASDVYRRITSDHVGLEHD